MKSVLIQSWGTRRKRDTNKRNQSECKYSKFVVKKKQSQGSLLLRTEFFKKQSQGHVFETVLYVFRFGKQIRYASRKARADTRKRVKGRFVKSGEPFEYDPWLITNDSFLRPSIHFLSSGPTVSWGRRNVFLRREKNLQDQNLKPRKLLTQMVMLNGVKKIPNLLLLFLSFTSFLTYNRISAIFLLLCILNHFLLFLFTVHTDTKTKLINITKFLMIWSISLINKQSCGFVTIHLDIYHSSFF